MTRALPAVTAPQFCSQIIRVPHGAFPRELKAMGAAAGMYYYYFVQRMIVAQAPAYSIGTVPAVWYSRPMISVV